MNILILGDNREVVSILRRRNYTVDVFYGPAMEKALAALKTNKYERIIICDALLEFEEYESNDDYNEGAVTVRFTERDFVAAITSSNQIRETQKNSKFLIGVKDIAKAYALIDKFSSANLDAEYSPLDERSLI